MSPVAPELWRTWAVCFLILSACGPGPSETLDAGAPDSGTPALDGGSGVDAAVVAPAFEFGIEDPRSGTVTTGTVAPSYARVTVALTARPDQPVTIVAHSGGFEARARFAGGSGVLSLADEAPLDGTYAGVDADGIFWSMRATSSTVVGEHTSFSALVGSATVAQGELRRVWRAPGTVVRRVSERGLVGALYLPRGAGPHPALLVFGGSEGGIDTALRLSQRFAAFGYAALALAYFGAPGLPNTLTRVPLEYMETGLVWLAEQPEIDATRLGVYGGSRGGELALLLGATFPDLHAVIADVPSGVTWGGFTPFGRQVASWTLAGADIPFIPYGGGSPVVETTPEGEMLTHYTPLFLEDLAGASSTALDLATIRVEHSAGPVLMIGGADDQLWPSCVLAQIAMDRLVAAGHDARYADELVCYPESGHWIGVPGYPTSGIGRYFDPRQQLWFALGGTPAGTAHAQRDLLGRMLRFLDAALGPP